MLQLLKLLLPALIPSWNFFDIIAPSPRVQFALLESAGSKAQDWHNFRPRPAKVTLMQMLAHMLWNARWNDTLYAISCAERIMEQPTQHSEDEIFKRIIDDVTDILPATDTAVATHVQFRLLLVERRGDAVEQAVTYVSSVRSLDRQEPM